MSDDNILDYKINAVSAVKFYLVFSENDLDNKKEMRTFRPQMAHQVFGSGETIFGYKRLSIDLYYLHNSSRCYVDVKYSAKADHLDADDIMVSLDPWLPTNYVSTEEEFRKIVQNEKHNKIFGSIIREFEKETEVSVFPSKSITCKYKITKCDPTDPHFQEYHQRFETFIIWFIDAANFIDLSDERWLIFYIYEEYKHPKSDEVIITPIGFTAIYRFFSYPSNIRARISQFFILPTHQRKGFGMELYTTVFNHILSIPEIVDLTVEEASESFQKLRDVCDSYYIYTNLKESNSTINGKSAKLLNNYMAQHKICKKQASRITDILQYHSATKSGGQMMEAFSDALLKKMEFQMEKEFGAHKRAKGLMPEESPDPKLMMSENLKARFASYSKELASVSVKLSEMLL